MFITARDAGVRFALLHLHACVCLCVCVCVCVHMDRLLKCACICICGGTGTEEGGREKEGGWRSVGMEDMRGRGDGP